MNTSPILVTGAAGFIGMHCSARLLAQGHQLIGIDNLNDYYDPRLKQARLAQLTSHPGFRFIETDIANRDALEKLFTEVRPERVLHLAAQAGVRYSLKNPHAYVQSNLVGFVNILEGCRHHGVQHLVYASSSSVYGANTKVPFAVGDPVDHPVSLYAATKKSNELMAYSYSHLYGLPTTGLRFFTVYGPWGRPDMSPWLFTSAILEGRTIDVFNHGKMQRDFTYIDDIVEGTLRVLDQAPTGAPPYRLYNIGNHQPVELMDFIGTLERVLGVEAKKNFMPMQPGDVPVTYADTEDLRRDVGFAPSTPLSLGLQHWADWYRSYLPG
ncbi:MAG: NAD-dependent epimerase [Betaproteobacteria bacterium]|nr:NAD-dependent epimerase [Betaproteobacteria bacterium]